MPSTSAIVAGVAAVAVTTSLLFLAPRNLPELPELHVAFIGNSIMFTYDLPRLVETMAAHNNNDGNFGSSLVQDSCLHGSLNLQTQLERGNGMYNRFTNPAASSNETAIDYGACSIPQLFFGYDEYLEEDGYYTDDGYNPCFEEEGYLEYLQERYQQQGPPRWDAVVLNDRTAFPGLPDKRAMILEVLDDSYVGMLLESGATPVLLMTYGYNQSAWDPSDSSLAEQLGDVPEFSSHVYYGYQQYAALLADRLPEAQRPLLAPAGLAFLAVYEEDRGMWKRLFYFDGLHPSPHGSFLLGCVLFATLYGRMPATQVALPHDMSELWDRARKLQVTNSDPPMDYPTRDEAAYLYRVAARVALDGHVPRTLLDADQVVELESQYYSSSNNNDDNANADADADDDYND